MKLRNAIMCGAMAAVMMLAGCGRSKYSVKSEKPAEIEGFNGNLSDVAPKSGDLIATFEIEDFGTIKAVLFPEAAPVGVDNFQKLCDAGFYEGLKIHRVVKNFMFQGGSANGDGTGGDAMVNGGSFDIETAQNARHFYGALCYANADSQNSTQFYFVNDKERTDLGEEVPVETLRARVDANLNELNTNAAKVEKEIAESYYRQRVVYYQRMLDFAENATDEIRARYLEKGGTPGLDGNYTVFGQVYEGFDVLDAISEVKVVENSGGEVSLPEKDIIIKSVTVTVCE